MKNIMRPVLLLALIATFATGQTTPYLGLNKPAHGSNVNTSEIPFNKNWDILDSWAARVTGGKWDIRTYGAVCAGNPGASNDTQAVINAVKAMGSTMGTLVIPDGCTWDPSQVPWRWKTYRRGNGHVEQLIELQGDTFVTSKLIIPIDISVTCAGGKWGTSLQQFQKSPGCTIWPWGKMDFTVQFVGNEAYLKDVNVNCSRNQYNNTMGALQIGGEWIWPWAGQQYGGAVAYLDNVGAGCQVAGSHSLEIDREFWVWSQHGRYLNGGPNGWSIAIVNRSPVKSNQSGLMRFDNTIIAGGGIYQNCYLGGSANNCGYLTFDDLLRESGTGPLFQSDSDAQAIAFRRTGEADPAKISPCAIYLPNAKAAILGLHISDSSFTLSVCGDGAKNTEVYWDGIDDTRFADATLAGNRLGGYAVRSWRWDIDWVGTDILGSFGFLPVGITVKNFPNTPATADSCKQDGVNGPYGEPNVAWDLTASIQTACRIWNWPARPTAVNVGDWVCIGAKVKGQIGLNPGSGFGNLGFTNNPGSPIIDGDFNGTGSTSLSTNKKAGPYYDEWHDSINCGKVTANPGTYGTNFDLFSDGKHHTYVAYPWLAVFPSSTFSDDDVLYLKRFGLRNVRPANTLGAYNFPAPITVPKITLSGAGATGKVACIKSDKSLGYCSTQPDSTGACTCN